jgi:hypothetical protein
MAEQTKNAEETAEEKRGELMGMGKGLKKTLAGIGIALAVSAGVTGTVLGLNGCDTGTGGGNTQEYTQYTVTFLDGPGGNVLKTQTVNAGGSAIPPSSPTKTGYTFDGWAGNYTNITGNTTVYATWRENTIDPPTLPAFPTANVNVAIPTRINNVTPFESLVPKFSTDESGVGAAVRNTFMNMRNQADNFVNWFDGAEDTYPALSAKFGALKTKENEIKTAAGTATLAPVYHSAAEGKVDGILDTVLGNAGAERTAFDKYFDAHSKGAYITQRQWNGTLAAGDTKAAQVAEFVSLCGSINGLTQPAVNSGSGNVTNMTAVLNELKGLMRTSLTAGFGFTAADTNGTAMINALITQIAEDLPQFGAFIKDMQNQGMSGGIEIGGMPVGLTMAPTSAKSSHLADDSFTPAYLRTRTKDDETKMA